MSIQQIRLALIGPSGAGKSTTAQLLVKTLGNAVVCSVAKPLSEIQDQIYNRLGETPPSQLEVQDGQMMQVIRALIEKRNPGFLKSDFIRRLRAIPIYTHIINDDCRLAMFDTLADQNFLFVWVEGRSNRIRPDFTTAQVNGNPGDVVISKDRCQFTINNTGDLAQLLDAVKNLVKTMTEALVDSSTTMQNR